jgi:hypothetical protein
MTYDPHRADVSAVSHDAALVYITCVGPFSISSQGAVSHHLCEPLQGLVVVESDEEHVAEVLHLATTTITTSVLSPIARPSFQSWRFGPPQKLLPDVRAQRQSRKRTLGIKHADSSTNDLHLAHPLQLQTPAAHQRQQRAATVALRQHLVEKNTGRGRGMWFQVHARSLCTLPPDGGGTIEHRQGRIGRG